MKGDTETIETEITGEKMQYDLMSSIEITPKEVKSFKTIPVDSLPILNLILNIQKL
ncbi:MAG: hypothetical protein IPK25_19815 [Saprospiraceae bacterium]|nr:hypothetical protein [Saprospiraceae bacterium]